MVKNPPADAGDRGLFPGRRISHAAEQLTCVSQLLSPCAVLCLVALSCPTLCEPLDCSPPGSSVHGDSPGKNTGVGCSALLQGIFPTQGLNPGLLHCRQIRHCLSHLGSPWATLLKLGPLEPMLTARDATTMRSPHPATRGRP